MVIEIEQIKLSRSLLVEMTPLPFDGRKEVKAVTCRPTNSIHIITDSLSGKGSGMREVEKRRLNIPDHIDPL
jgi:hypothetical protein